MAAAAVPLPSNEVELIVREGDRRGDQDFKYGDLMSFANRVFNLPWSRVQRAAMLGGTTRYSIIVTTTSGRQLEFYNMKIRSWQGDFDFYDDFWEWVDDDTIRGDTIVPQFLQLELTNPVDVEVSGESIELNAFVQGQMWVYAGVGDLLAADPATEVGDIAGDALSAALAAMDLQEGGQVEFSVGQSKPGAFGFSRRGAARVPPGPPAQADDVVEEDVGDISDDIRDDEVAKITVRVFEEGPMRKRPVVRGQLLGAAVCSDCGSDDAEFRCTGCRAAFYCGKACQVRAWPSHERTCGGVF
jgi:hypothetical protein